jgi:hypothetical protein
MAIAIASRRPMARLSEPRMIAGWLRAQIEVAGIVLRGGFTTRPAFRHEVQTWRRLGDPSTSARTRWMLGSQRRFVRR